MKQIENLNLYAGASCDLSGLRESDWAFVHATKCIHYQILGWDRLSSEPDINSPNYICYEKENHLSLNWSNSTPDQYSCCGPQTFIKVLNFIDKWLLDRNVLVQCDKGCSRSPTLCLLYLAKRYKTMPNDSYRSACIEFRKIMPEYIPDGIGLYVAANWNRIW